MSERKEPEKRQETPEERERRLRRMRRKREQMRRRRRKALILRGILAVVILVMVIGVGTLIAKAVKKNSVKSKKKDPEKKTESQEKLEAVDVKSITHLSFSTLIEVPETAFEQEDTQAASLMDQNHLTVEEFKGILQQLYDNGYVLVSLKDLVITDEKTGDFSEAELMLPAGKKPLLISQQNVSYDFSLSGQGFASRLMLDEAGKITNERIRLDGSVTSGDFDVVTCVDRFVEEHPDFSHNGARGVLGLTGYNGILGYRTSAYLGGSAGNKYASRYGIFDTAQEIEKVRPLIEALKTEGWEFACNGYDLVSYASGLEQVQADMAMWKEQVESLVGATDILMYPMGTDISGWNCYDQDDETYAFLKEQGFRFFMGMDVSRSGIQLTEEYLRCSYINLDGYRMYQDLYQQAGRFTGILDFQPVYDETRPSAAETQTSGENSEEENDPEEETT